MISLDPTAIKHRKVLRTLVAFVLYFSFNFDYVASESTHNILSFIRSLGGYKTY